MNGNYPVQSHLLQHTPSENNLTRYFFQHSVSHQIVNQQGNIEDPVTTQSPHILPAFFSPIDSTITPLVTTTGKPWRPNSFPPMRERDRGSRADLFNSHWQQEDHRGYHVYYGRAPKRSQIETYNPWIILNNVKDGAISIYEGKNLAKFLVRMKAYSLQKADMWTDPWGHNKRQTSTCR
ncbi:hypothetical protein EI94DRAFT_1739025 [Lactarius quietus]|nr:hypothetical protein EI94DRAFT_1739025 [Lactarius quietus]